MSDTAKIQGDIIEQFAECIAPQDVNDVMMTVERAVENTSLPKLADKYEVNTKAESREGKTVAVKRTIQATTSKYPEIFNSLKDNKVVQIDRILGNLNSLALASDDEDIQIKASKAVLDTALRIEKMTQTKKTEIIDISEKTIGEKTIYDIIDEYQ